MWITHGIAVHMTVDNSDEDSNRMSTAIHCNSHCQPTVANVKFQKLYWV